MIGKQAIVLLQIIILWIIFYKIYKTSNIRDKRAPIDDIGVLFLLALAIYSTLPPISWLVQGGEYSLISGRLFRLQPDVSEVIYLLNISIAYSLGFSFIYFKIQKKILQPENIKIVKIKNSKVFASLFIVLFTYLITIFLFTSGKIRSAESYVDSYLVIQELPLPLRQFLKLISAFSGVATLIITIALLQSWPRYRRIFWLYVVTILFSFNAEGGRTGVAISLLSMVISWHVLIKPISSKKVIFCAIFALISFLLLGIYRNIGSLSGIGQIGFEGIGVGEFDVLWANAIELLQAKKSGLIYVPFSTLTNEFYSFIPSQLLWFQKNSLSIWFLDIFHPYLKDLGGGLAFGALSQAVIGGGIIEALIRGIILGGLAGLLMRWYRKPTNNWWKFPVYLYILVWSYQSIRDTTFTLIGTIVQTTLPAVLVILIISKLFSFSRNLKNQSTIKAKV